MLELYPVDKGTALLEIVSTKYIVHIPNRRDPEEIKKILGWQIVEWIYWRQTDASVLFCMHSLYCTIVDEVTCAQGTIFRIIKFFTCYHQAEQLFFLLSKRLNFAGFREGQNKGRKE